MQRRNFIKSLAVTFLAPSMVFAEQKQHPFAKLVDIDTGRTFQPVPNAFNLTLFMTAQQSYPSCGAAFLSVQYVRDTLPNAQSVRPILIMPKISDQMNPEDLRNLSAARSYGSYQILTGALEDVCRAANDVGGFFEIMNNKVSAHTEDAFFLTSGGKKMFSIDVNNNYEMANLAGRIMTACGNKEKQHLCL